MLHRPDTYDRADAIIAAGRLRITSRPAGERMLRVLAFARAEIEAGRPFPSVPRIREELKAPTTTKAHLALQGLADRALIRATATVATRKGPRPTGWEITTLGGEHR